MAENRSDEIKLLGYVSQETFELNNKLFEERFGKFGERLDLQKDISDIKLDISEMKSEIKELNLKIDNVEKRLDARIDALDVKIDGVEKNLNNKIDMKIEHVIDTFTIAINDTNSRIDDLRQDISKTFTVFGIGVALFIGIVQIVIAVLPKFFN